jgi:hypothetical protein
MVRPTDGIRSGADATIPLPLTNPQCLADCLFQLKQTAYNTRRETFRLELA